MSKWLIFQQTGTEKPANVANWLTKSGQEYDVLHLWRQPMPSSFAHYKALIVMGGIMSANDEKKFPFLREEIKVIEKWLKMNRPVLGICLGAQLMARALGEKVYPGSQPEIGWHTIHFTPEAAADSALQSFTPEMTVFEWHYETFDRPDNVTVLASSNNYKNQIFRYGETGYALQFHPEMDAALIQEWVAIHRQKLLKMDAGLPQKILSGTDLYLHDLGMIGEAVIKKLSTIEKRK